MFGRSCTRTASLNVTPTDLAPGHTDFEVMGTAQHTMVINSIPPTIAPKSTSWKAKEATGGGKYVGHRSVVHSV
jgi:hypothetical protein